MRMISIQFRRNYVIPVLRSFFFVCLFVFVFCFCFFPGIRSRAFDGDLISEKTDSCKTDVTQVKVYCYPCKITDKHGGLTGR